MADCRIRIGVVGLGRIGWGEHCPQIAKHPEFELCAVQDTVKERRLEGEQKYGVPSFSTLRTMMRASNLEAVVIASPTHLHAAMAQEALRSGCHVLLEKPMAANSRDAAAIVRIARYPKTHLARAIASN
jgi:predicted dehydrogenase